MTITETPTGIQFLTETNHGFQLVLVEFRLSEPTLSAASVSSHGERITYTPLRLTQSEITSYFSMATQIWADLRSHQPGVSSPTSSSKESK